MLNIKIEEEIEDKKREFLFEFGNILIMKNELFRLFDQIFKKQIKEEPLISTLRKVFLPIAFIILEETLELIIEETARNRMEAKIL